MHKEKAGNIIYISSIYGIVGAPDIPAYHATKAAVRIMAKIDALLYTKDIIRVNSIHLGYIWTPMLENFIQEQAEKSNINVNELKKDLSTRQPIGHIGDPIDIAYGVLYLVSNESKFVTGSELVIDGGYTAT
jgi:NAD(P)-dependent dehydrogenase (short-subunit alcohol dehydrogenase family)